MSYVCVKKLSLGGKTYYPGDTIPDGVILSGRVDKLKAYGYIAEQETAPTAPKEPDERKDAPVEAPSPETRKEKRSTTGKAGKAEKAQGGEAG